MQEVPVAQRHVIDLIRDREEEDAGLMVLHEPEHPFHQPARDRVDLIDNRDSAPKTRSPRCLANQYRRAAECRRQCDQCRQLLERQISQQILLGHQQSHKEKRDYREDLSLGRDHRPLLVLTGMQGAAT